MNEFLHNFHFLRPYWLLSIILVIALGWRLLLVNRVKSNWEKVCDARLLPALLTQNQQRRHFWPYCLLLLAWLSIIIALAGPTWQRMPQAVYQNLNSTVILVDMSNAMFVSDVQPSRLERAKYKILDLLKNLHGTRVGLIAFTAEPFVAAPLTLDENTISLLIPSLSETTMPIAGCNIGAALTAGEQLLKQANAEGGNIILISADPASNNDIQIAESLAGKGMSISVLGVGTEQGAPMKQANGEFATDANGTVILSKFDKTNLEQLAKVGHGNYTNLTVNNQDINLLLEKNNQTLSQHAKLAEQTANIWYDEGSWLVIIALAIGLLAFRRGYLNEVLAK